MAFIKVNGADIKTPSTFSVGIYDESAPDSGRDLTGLMHKNTIATKRTISLSWRNISEADVRSILNAFMAQEYFTVTYYDPTSASQVTKTFYLGDREVPLYNKALGLYESLTFNVIER